MNTNSSPTMLVGRMKLTGKCANERAAGDDSRTGSLAYISLHVATRYEKKRNVTAKAKAQLSALTSTNGTKGVQMTSGQYFKTSYIDGKRCLDEDLNVWIEFKSRTDALVALRRIAAFSYSKSSSSNAIVLVDIGVVGLLSVGELGVNCRL